MAILAVIMKHVAASLRLVLGPCPRSALSWAGRGTPAPASRPAGIRLPGSTPVLEQVPSTGLDRPVCA